MEIKRVYAAREEIQSRCTYVSVVYGLLKYKFNEKEEISVYLQLASCR